MMAIVIRLGQVSGQTDLMGDFTNVYAEEMPKMMQAIVRDGISYDDAEDIVANATIRMLSLVQQARVAPGEESVRKLFWTELKYRRADYRRSQVRDAELKAELSRYALNEAAGEHDERLSERLAAVGLPDQDIELVRLRYEEGWDFEHIGRAMKLKPATARKRMSRLLKRLCELLGRDVLAGISEQLGRDVTEMVADAQPVLVSSHT